MKKARLLIKAAVIVIITLTSLAGGNSFSQATSSVNVVKIGDQVWMAENLNVDRFRNGDLIPLVKTAEEWKAAGDNEQPACCYYLNNSNYGAIYGKLYNWYAVNDPRGLAPEGFKIPSQDDLKQLINLFGGESVAGPKLKSTDGWSMPGNGDNESKFNGLPGGYCSSTTYGGFYKKIGEVGEWWSSTDSYTDAYGFMLGHDNSNAYITLGSKDHGGSVRCLKE